GEGSYDLTWTLLDASNNVLASRTGQNWFWLAAPGTDPGAVSLAGSSLGSSSITLQAGVVNRVSATFSIENDDSAAHRIVARLRIKRNGDTTWITDLASDKLVSVPAGTSSYTLGFAVPRYLPTGSYDVTWELDSADLSTVDSAVVSHALTITNP